MTARPPANFTVRDFGDDELDAARNLPRSNGFIARARGVSPAPETRSPKLPTPVRAIDVPDEETVAYSVDPLVTAGDVGMIVGEDGSMKSTLALLVTGAFAGRYRAFGRFATAGGPVLFVSEEDSAAVLKNRLLAMCRGHGWHAETVLSNVSIFAKCEVRLTSSAWRMHLLGEITRIGAKLVILDPLAELMTGEENSNTEARTLVQAMRSLSQPTGAAVLGVHHFGKPAEGKRPRDLIRGASAIPSASRCTYAVTHDDVAHEVTVTCLKMSRGEKLRPFVLRYVIDAEPERRAVRKTARFEYVSVQEATLDHAETFVSEQLNLGERMTTTELKAAAKGTGVSGADIGRALKSLGMRHLVNFEDGPRGAKFWGWAGSDRRKSGEQICDSTLPGKVGKVENDLARQGGSLPGKVAEDGSTLPTPFRGQGGNQPALTLGKVGKVDDGWQLDWEPDESQLVFNESLEDAER